MSSVPVTSEGQEVTAGSAAVDMRLEVVVIPVSDVDRAKDFYARLGWRLDADVATGDDFRLVQFTPPGSGCSVSSAPNLTSAAPGSAPVHLSDRLRHRRRARRAGRAAASRSARSSTVPPGSPAGSAALPHRDASSGPCAR